MCRPEPSPKVLEYLENRPGQNQACAHHERRLQALRPRRTSSKSKMTRTSTSTCSASWPAKPLVDVVRGGKIVEKEAAEPARAHRRRDLRVNPRCVTTTEPGIKQMFHLVHSERLEYRCDYCDEEADLRASPYATSRSGTPARSSTSRCPGPLPPTSPTPPPWLTAPTSTPPA